MIGAGVVGLAVAQRLLAEGREVTLIDPAVPQMINRSSIRMNQISVVRSSPLFAPVITMSIVRSVARAARMASRSWSIAPV